MSATTRCSSWWTTPTGNGTGSSGAKSRWNQMYRPAAYGSSAETGPRTETNPPSASIASTRRAPIASANRASR